MNIITFKTLGKLINSDIDYIATALTPWHAYGIVAAIKKIEDDENRKLKGLVLIMRNFDEGYFLNEQYFNSLDCNVYYFDYKRSILEHLQHIFYKIRFAVTVNNDSKKNFYVFSQLTPNINILSYISKIIINRKFVSVICDEGIGSYFINNYIFKRRKTLYNSFFAKLYYCVEANIFLPILINRLKDKKLIVDCCLLKYNGEKFIDNGIGIYFKYAISESVSNSKFDFKNNDYIHKYVILNTQPFDAEDIFDEQIVFDLYKRIINICNNCGYNVYIKPHPRENNFSKLNFLGVGIIDTRLTQEELNVILKNKPKAIISIISTTLLTSYTIFGIDSISLGRFLISNKTVSRYLIEYISFMNKKFDKIINFPSNDSDFLTILKSIT